jgi:hypothetical protein
LRQEREHGALVPHCKRVHGGIGFNANPSASTYSMEVVWECRDPNTTNFLESLAISHLSGGLLNREAGPSYNNFTRAASKFIGVPAYSGTPGLIAAPTVTRNHISANQPASARGERTQDPEEEAARFQGSTQDSVEEVATGRNCVEPRATGVRTRAMTKVNGGAGNS